MYVINSKRKFLKQDLLSATIYAPIYTCVFEYFHVFCLLSNICKYHIRDMNAVLKNFQDIYIYGLDMYIYIYTYIYVLIGTVST